MKANKSILDDVGGAFAFAQIEAVSPNDLSNTDIEPANEVDYKAALYPQPDYPVPIKHHNAKSVNNRLKAKRLTEGRLIRLSDELSKLADEIRYLNPLMAEVLDEAWDATEDAIEMLSNEHVW